MENNFIRCPECSKPIPVNSNYCYLCGLPISENAKQNEKLKTQNAQLMVLTKVSNILTDSKDLELVKGIVYQIKNN